MDSGSRGISEPAVSSLKKLAIRRREIGTPARFSTARLEVAGLNPCIPQHLVFATDFFPKCSKIKLDKVKKLPLPLVLALAL
jgi:hypothetical protein